MCGDDERGMRINRIVAPRPYSYFDDSLDVVKITKQ
jgi:hypothetical protein